MVNLIKLSRLASIIYDILPKRKLSSFIFFNFNFPKQNVFTYKFSIPHSLSSWVGSCSYADQAHHNVNVNEVHYFCGANDMLNLSSFMIQNQQKLVYISPYIQIAGGKNILYTQRPREKEYNRDHYLFKTFLHILSLLHNFSKLLFYMQKLHCSMAWMAHNLYIYRVCARMRAICNCDIYQRRDDALPCNEWKKVFESKDFEKDAEQEHQ